MLKCREIVDHADEYLAGELGWRRRMAVKMHIFMCRHCRRYMRQLKWLLGSIPFMHGQASDEEVEDVMRRIED